MSPSKKLTSLPSISLPEHGHLRCGRHRRRAGRLYGRQVCRQSRGQHNFAGGACRSRMAGAVRWPAGPGGYGRVGAVAWLLHPARHDGRDGLFARRPAPGLQSQIRKAWVVDRRLFDQAMLAPGRAGGSESSPSLRRCDRSDGKKRAASSPWPGARRSRQR